MRRALIATAMAVALIASACTRVSDGVPTVRSDARAPTSDPARTSQTPTPSDDPEDAMPGVVATTQPPQPCTPDAPMPVQVVAQVSDPQAPTATVGVPDLWSMSSGGADPQGARLQGPDGIWASVTISPTPLGPAAAFRQYDDDRTSGAAISTMSLLPGQLCGYSGQKLMGMLSAGTEGTATVQYQDRVVHVPGPVQDYLIAVRVEAPSGAPGFTEAASQLTDDFGIGLP